MIVVTGTGRSGTSLWMQVLRAGGLPVIGEAFPLDWRARGRELNPHGFYESSLREGIHPLSARGLDARETRRHVVKVFAHGVPVSSRRYLHRLVLTVRPWPEFAQSLARMEALAPSDHPALSDPECWWRQQHLRLLQDCWQRRLPLLRVGLSEALSQPRAQIERVARFLEEDLDLDAAQAAIDPSIARPGAPGDAFYQWMISDEPLSLGALAHFS